MGQAENTGGDRESETLLIRASLLIRSIGAAGYVFWGVYGRLFKIYDRTDACGRFLQILEERGAELNIPGRSFASDRFAASHPCQEKRRFTVRSGTCSILYGGKIKIDGRQHKLLFKISGFAGDTQDVHFVFALLRHLAEAGVTIYGIETTDDRVQCMMQRRFEAIENISE